MMISGIEFQPGSFRELTARELTQLRRSGTAPPTSEQQPRKGKGRKAGQ